MADKIKKIDPKEWQGRYCIECIYSPTCTGAGVMKNACRGFEPRVRKDGEVRAFTDEELKTYQDAIDRKSIPTSVNIMNVMDGREND